MLRTKDLYWLAGLLEGEGSFYLSRKWDVNVGLGMTDEDVVRRVNSILPGITDNRPLPSGKTVYRWRIGVQHEAAGLMMTLLPLMGMRKTQIILANLALWKKKPLPKSMWTHCKHGHELSGDNLLIVREGKYEKRRCRKCGVLRARKYNRSKLQSEPIRRRSSSRRAGSHDPKPQRSAAVDRA